MKSNLIFQFWEESLIYLGKYLHALRLCFFVKLFLFGFVVALTAFQKIDRSQKIVFNDGKFLMISNRLQLFKKNACGRRKNMFFHIFSSKNSCKKSVYIFINGNSLNKVETLLFLLGQKIEDGCSRVWSLDFSICAKKDICSCYYSLFVQIF